MHTHTGSHAHNANKEHMHTSSYTHTAEKVVGLEGGRVKTNLKARAVVKSKRERYTMGLRITCT